jgi:hypothetical protein
MHTRGFSQILLKLLLPSDRTHSFRGHNKDSSLFLATAQYFIKQKEMSLSEAGSAAWGLLVPASPPCAPEQRTWRLVVPAGLHQSWRLQLGGPTFLPLQSFATLRLVPLFVSRNFPGLFMVLFALVPVAK